MQIQFGAVSEIEPGPIWAALFQRFWPAYRRWWAARGLIARPTYLECRRALWNHMPEILPLYDQLCELAGGGDNEARFLSFYCPPPYMAGCSQAVWHGPRPLLVRNYDYSPYAFDAMLLHTGWQGRQVIGTGDGMFGLLDGMNDSGLVLSLTFGGRREIADGFGIPLILRYILQTCSTLDEAAAVLRRVPCHMSYNVTALDAQGSFFTAYLAPDRATVIADGVAVATNHQAGGAHSAHARITASVEREQCLLNLRRNRPASPVQFIGNFLRPPLHSTAFSTGFATLYTAAYLPESGEVQLWWPQLTWNHSFTNFDPGRRDITYQRTSSVAFVLGQ